MRDKIIMSVLIGIIIGLCIGVFPVIQSGGNFNQKVETAISKAEETITKDLDKRIGYLETHRHYGK